MLLSHIIFVTFEKYFSLSNLKEVLNNKKLTAHILYMTDKLKTSRCCFITYFCPTRHFLIFRNVQELTLFIKRWQIVQYKTRHPLRCFYFRWIITYNFKIINIFSFAIISDSSIIDYLVQQLTEKSFFAARNSSAFIHFLSLK